MVVVIVVVEVVVVVVAAVVVVVVAVVTVVTVVGVHAPHITGQSSSSLGFGQVSGSRAVPQSGLSSAPWQVPGVCT